ncbi:MAG: metallophosphoesterase family protein [Clostridia bacterium]|nr:metallophosphoesterase family protein [Clostridia bacterium]
MKLLLISDEESPFLWEYFKPGMLDDVDAIISCGDLNPHYLSFLVTMGKAPVYYVHGNHDGRYDKDPPEGCECIEDQIVNIGGLRVLGLGGCLRYGPGPHQYTEKEMRRRIRRLWWQLLLHKGVDVIVTHAPVRGIGDEDHISHRGFEVFRELLEKHKPRYWFFGHVHTRYGGNTKRVFCQGETTLINACERFMLDTETSERQ